MRGETRPSENLLRPTRNFNPLPSCEGRRDIYKVTDLVADISIHSPHARGDVRKGHRVVVMDNFNPLPSCEGRPFSRLSILCSQKFQSTPLMRGETIAAIYSLPIAAISIHSPHARGDQLEQYQVCRYQNFNPLPSCEGRLRRDMWTWPKFLFQSTPLMRGETSKALHLQPPLEYFNPLPSCEGRRGRPKPPLRVVDFNPLPSCEGRPRRAQTAFASQDFNPLPSCEGRRIQTPSAIHIVLFQSTPLMRGETNALLFNADGTLDFNPLPSCEGRLFIFDYLSFSRYFNPLPSCEGRPNLGGAQTWRRYFNPLPSCEGRQDEADERQYQYIFQSTPLMRGETANLG